MDPLQAEAVSNLVDHINNGQVRVARAVCLQEDCSDCE